MNKYHSPFLYELSLLLTQPFSTDVKQTDLLPDTV